MPTYIAAYDGTDASRAAVRFAVQLGRAENAEVIAVHVYPQVVPYRGRGALHKADVAMQEDLRAKGQEVLDGLDVEGVVRRLLAGGSPAGTLHELAVAEHASLISVGVTHHEHLGRLIPGSVGATLLHGSPCPVVAVPAGEPEGIATIGVAYDGGEESQRALAAAERLARALGARLLLFGAVEIPVFAGPISTALEVQPTLRESVEFELRETAGRVHGIDVDVRTVTGPAGPMIAEAARGEVDLLVTGSRSYGPLRSVLLGSVSRHLVDNAYCPVLVVPRSSANEGEREPG